MSPYEELTRTFKLSLQKGEDFATFAVRATDRVNKCNDAQWKELSEELQTWVNTTLETREANRTLGDDGEPASLPELTGFPEASETVDEETGEVTDDAEADAADEESSDEGVEESSEEAQDAASDDDGDASPSPARRKAPTAGKKVQAKPGKGKVRKMPQAAVKEKAAPPKKAVVAKKGNGELDKKSKIIHDAVARAKGATAVEVQALMKRASPPDMAARLTRIGVKFKVDGERDGRKVYKLA